MPVFNGECYLAEGAFELGLLGIEDALKRVAQQGLPDLQSGLQLSPSTVSANVGGGNQDMTAQILNELRANKLDEVTLAHAIVSALQRGD